MIGFGVKISKNYALELTVFHPFRSVKDGLTLFLVDIDLSWYKGDHNPKFKIMVALFNTVLIEFCVYNVHHL